MGVKLHPVKTKEQEFNHLGVFRRGAQVCAPTYEQFVGFI